MLLSGFTLDSKMAFLLYDSMQLAATTPAQPYPLPSRHHWFYFVSGLIFLALAKTKNRLRGYVTPKPFNVTETERSIAYDLRIVANGWQGYNKQPAAAILKETHLER